MTRALVRRAVQCVGMGLLVLDTARRATLYVLRAEFGGVEQIVPDLELPEQRDPQTVGHG